ncbi:MAG: hypothetical protein QOJ21_2956 [Solirubrobacteraceae bacterium]|nr:hypothetical protein [Solirubrobacteraceae bacterium]
MRERFDAGTGLVALGAILLLISLFVDWYDRSGDAWAAFELTDIVLAACAIAALVGIVPRYAGLGRAVPALCFAAFAIIAVQVIDPPPGARGDALEAGAWLALGAGALMALGAAVSAASISITVDVHGRERRRRTAAIDAREAREAASASADGPAEEEAPAAEPRRARRRASGAAAAGEATAQGEPRRRSGGAVAVNDEEATTTLAGEGRRSPADTPPDESRRLWRTSEPAPPPDGGAADPAGDDPDRTQALDPVDRPKDGA